MWTAGGAVVAVSAALFALLPGARWALRDSAARGGRSALEYSLERPRRVLGIAIVVALLGFALDPAIKVVSDPRDLVPQDLSALRDLNQLEDATGVSGDIYVTVNANDVSDAKVVAWMTKFQNDLLAAHGYQTGETCRQAKSPPELCPGPSLSDFIGRAPGQAQNARAVLDALPPYFSSALVAPDRRTAHMAFGIR